MEKQATRTVSAESRNTPKGGEFPKCKTARQALLDRRRQLLRELRKIEKYLGLIV